MRYSREVTFSLNEDEKLMAVTLGADFCAEHEWGIKELEQNLGIDRKVSPRQRIKLGLEIHRATAIGAKQQVDMLLFDAGEPGPSGRETILAFGEEVHYAKRAENTYEILGLHVTPLAKADSLGRIRKTREGRETKYPPHQTIAKWGERGFAVATRDDANRAHLATLHEALKNGEMVVMTRGGSNPFQVSGGLTLGVWSAIPEELKTDYREQITDLIKLDQAALDTGIKARLEKAGFKYFALRADWLKKGFSRQDGRVVESAYPVIFFLNPPDSHKNVCGWYTVEELDEWIQGRGPVVAVPEQEKASRGRAR